MAVYTIQLDDGRIAKLEGPEGASNEELGAELVKWQKAQPNPVTQGMSGYEKFMAGAGKAVADTGLGLRQAGASVADFASPRMAGQGSRADELRQEVKGVRQRDAPLMDTGAGMTGNIAGNIAMALLPGGIAVQGGKMLMKIPAAAKIAQALMGGGRAAMMPKTIAGAGTVGAIQGAVQPSESLKETALNAGIGGAGGAAVPALIRSGQVVKALVDPMTQSGQRQIVGRAINQAAGSPEDAARALTNLKASQQPFVGPVPEGEIARQMMGEIVPGSVPTTAQAAGVPSIASLSRAAGSVDAQSQNALSQRMAEQNAARYRQVENIAGSTGGRDFAAINRKVVGDDMYEQARRGGIDPAALTPEAQANIANFQQRVPPEILASAQKLAKINGVPLDNASSVQGMHWVKKAIDGEIEAAKRAGNTDLSRAYTGLQNDLLGGLDELSPAYGAARREFAAMSKPINEMDVAQEVLNKSTSALPRAMDDPALNVPSVRPEAFARALSDKTASNVVRSGATLEGVMQPRNLQAMQNVQEDLARANFAQTAGKEMGGSDTAQKLAFANLAQQAGLPKWVSPQLLMTGLGTAGGALAGGPFGAGAGAAVGALTKAGAKQVYQDTNTEMSRKLAEALLNPQTAAQLMEAGMVSPAMQQLVNNSRGSGGVLGAQMAPYLLNGIAPGTVPRLDLSMDLGSQR